VDPFWGPIVQEVLKQFGKNLLENVGKVFANLWNKRDEKLIPPEATPFNTPPMLPLSLTPLVGREADFAGVLGALSNNRLVTITGLGGVGKTALAQTIARWAWEEERAKNKTLRGPRGVPYVALDALTDGRELADFVRRKLLPDSVPPAEADENARRDFAVRVLADALNAQARLLVLDNFESALNDDEGAARALDFVRALVASLNESVRVLVTSRRALALISLEAEYPLEPLEEKFGIKLFYERAGDAVSANDRATIAEICRLEDYLPLGIELAGAAIQQRRRPLKEMLEALRVTPLDIEIADALGYPERQRGLAATLRYSYAHLPSDAARRLLCAFSVFRGGADRDAVKYVDGTDAWEKALGDLVSWKLLNVDTTREQWRYAMLATTEAFAKLQMKNAGAGLGLDEKDLSRRHAEFFVTVAARFDETPMERWRELEGELENIKAGADFAVRELEAREGAVVDELLTRVDALPSDAKDVRLAGAYALALKEFVFRRRPFEGREWLGAGLIAFHRAGESKIEGLMCNELGLWFKTRGELESALKLYDKSVVLKEALGEKAGLATTYNNIASIHYARGVYAQALTWYEKSVALYEAVGDKSGLATTYNNIGLIHDARGDYAEALTWYAKSVALEEELGNKAGLAATYNNIGEINRARGDYGEALTWYEKSVALDEELGDKAGLAAIYNNIGEINRARGDYGEALTWYEKSVALDEELGDKAGLATTYNNIGEIHRARGDYAEALAWYEKSVALNEVLSNKAALAATYNNIGLIHFAEGRYSDAPMWLTKSLDIVKQIGNRVGVAQGSFNAAILSLVMNNRTQAKSYAQESLRLYEELKLEKKAAEVRAWINENGLE